MSQHASYEIVDSLSTHLVIRDVGFHDRQLTITNDAEWVVEQLGSKLMHPEGKRLFVYDSSGNLDEFIWETIEVQAQYGTYTNALFVAFRDCPVDHHRDLVRWMMDQAAGHVEWLEGVIGPMNDLSEKAQQFFDRRKEVAILDGRFEGQSGALIDTDGDMCIVELDDETQVRVCSSHVYKVLT